jgi:8-oxo-dGTP pyrophosphatase MutT (NUDIX family)
MRSLLNLIIKILYQVFRLILQLFKPMTHGVRALMVRDGQVLLVRHVYEDKWFLPGGLVERGETLEEAIRREATEEAGAEIQNLHLFGVYTNFKNGWYDHITVFLCQEFQLTGQSDHEIERMCFFPLDDLPERISQGSRNRIQDFHSGETKRYGAW